ncbi:hypothetical protein LCGC14_2574580, partial [marine sediment metagenome]
RRDEQHQIQREALAEALAGLIEKFKESLNFRDLQVFEMIFYSQLRNKDVARILGLTTAQVGMIKHRSLEHLRRRLAGPSGGEGIGEESPALLTEVWESRRPSCPKRSTIGAYVLGTLDDAWHDYVDFHLNRLGCRFCLANLEDLQRHSGGVAGQALRERIMESTVGWLPAQQ